MMASEDEAARIQADANRVLESERMLIAPALATSNVAMLGPEVEEAYCLLLGYCLLPCVAQVEKACLLLGRSR